MNEHIVRSFEDELNTLTAECARMGGLTEAQVADAISAVVKRNAKLATDVVGRDDGLDLLEADIEKKAIRLIALRQPMANDLRRTVAAMKIAANLERCGDLAKNIAKRTLVIKDAGPMTALTRPLERMGRLVLGRLKEVLDAYTASDLERARAVWSRDDEVDEHYNSLFRELLTYMMGDPRTIEACAHLLFVAKNLERIGDHATNIAEIVHYEITGEELASAMRPKTDGLGQGGAMSPKILVVEDDDALASLLHYNLEKEGYEVGLAPDGEEALTLIKERLPDLIVLDWMLPKVSGIEVCRRLRSRPETRNLPIIMLTARSEESDRIRGLDTGADDYVVKPFAMSEFAARVRAVLRRLRPGLADDRVRVGDIVIDRIAHRVKRDGREVHLGPTEYRLLDHFMQHPGRVFSREQLLDAVWGSDVYVEARTVDVHVGRLRKALNTGQAADPIRTVRSAGYALEVEG